MPKCWLKGWLPVFDLRHLLKYKYMQIQIHVNTIKDTLQMLTVKIMKRATMFIEGGFTAVYCLIVSMIYLHHLSHHKCKKFKYIQIKVQLKI